MRDDRAGRLIATVRIHLRMRQQDVAELAAVSQSIVSLLERGRFEDVSVRNQRQVCRALGIDSEIDLRWRGGLGDALIDRAHAAIVESVTAELVAGGWQTLPEFTFNHFGERGSVDILAWHPVRRALLIIEVKSRIQDMQAMLLSMSRKVRLVPGLAAEQRGWRRSALGVMIAMPDSHWNRSVVAAHRSTFDASFAARTAACRAWVRAPGGDLAGLWFLPRSAVPSLTPSSPRRLRRPHAQPPSGDLPASGVATARVDSERNPGVPTAR